MSKTCLSIWWYMKVDNFVSNRLQNYISKFLLQLGPPKRSILATPLFQRSLQTIFKATGSELSGEFPLVDISWAIRYALRTVNFPFLLVAHTRWSLAPCVLRGMLKIASTSWRRNHWCIKCSFHSNWSPSSRSQTHVTCRPSLSSVTTLYVLRLTASSCYSV